MTKKTKKLLPVTGYDFICTNKECQFVNTRISFYESWPIAAINDVLKMAKETKDVHREHIEFLERKMKDGCKYALIIYPNTNNFEHIGWRRQYYCQECCTVWENDVLIADDGKEMISCKKCNNMVRNVSDIAKNGIFCPSCKKQLQKNVWITKTK